MPANPFTGQRIAALTQRVRANTKAEIIQLTTQLTERNQRAIAGTLGASVPIRRFVDGTLGKPLAEVKPDGFTLTEFQTFGHVVDEALRALYPASPYGPEEEGHYRDDHWLYVNGQRRDATVEGALVDIVPGDRVVIINVRPYARKIEGASRRRSRRQDARRPGLSVQAPNGVYEITARSLSARFGNLAFIKFTYEAAPGGLKPGGRSNRFPALEITARV